VGRAILSAVEILCEFLHGLWKRLQVDSLVDVGCLHVSRKCLAWLSSWPIRFVS